MSAIDYGLSGRRIILTGGAGGLGLPIARFLLDEGAHVLLTALEEQALVAASRALVDTRGTVVTIAADLTDPAAPAAIVDAAVRGLGGVDVLINNAGLGPGAIRPDFWKEKIRFWEEQIDYGTYAQVNFTAPATLAQLLVPAMIEAGWGRIINVTTSLATMLNRGCSPYGPTKASLEALTSVQSHDLEGTGVNANVVTPGGPTDTPMVPANPAIARETLIRPEVMGPVVRWLASPRSDEISGRRFLAAKWDSSLPDAEAAAIAGAPVAWPVPG
jgi:NAD(P)-dependent dehydrogenase (short-subunit alcohol dehydrogenase family)